MAQERHFDYSGGIWRLTPTIDPKFPERSLYDALNMVYTGDSDNPESMYGATQLGSALSGSTINGLFDYNQGTLIATSEDGKIYAYNAGTDTWAAESGARATGNATTSGKRWTATMFYGATTTADLLVMCSDDDADDPVKFDGSDATDLGGSPPGDGKFPTSWQGRLWMVDGHTLYWSAPNDCEDWTIGGGGGSLAVARGHDGPITGLAAFANSLFIFKKGSILRIGPLDVGSLGPNNLKSLNQVNGCVSHASIQEGEIGDANVLIWQSEHGIEAIGPSDNSAGFAPVDISRTVKPIFNSRNLSAMSTAFGLYNLNRKEYYAHFPTGGASVPSVALIGNCARVGKPARWTQMNRKNLTAGGIWRQNGNLYNQIVGDTTGNVYKMHDKDTVLWAGASIDRRFQSKFYVEGAPEKMKRYNWAFVSADRDLNAVDVRQLMLRQGLPTATANNEAYTPAGSLGWGVGAWDVEPWGGLGVVGERIRPTSSRRASGMQIIISGQGWFRVKGITIEARVLSSKIAA